MALDMRLIPNLYDDLVLWGGFLPLPPGCQRLLGLLGHYSLGTGLAAAYTVALPLLPSGPGWLQGLLFAETEHLLTFPSVALGDRTHPAVRTGRLPHLATWRYFCLETARHAAYGAVLGATMKQANS
jgi:hypothetical protein